MKIDVRQVPPEGMVLTGSLEPKASDLETDIIKFKGPLTVTAQVSKITNALTVHLALSAFLRLACSRCLEEFGVDLGKEIDLAFPVNESQPVIDLDPDIREEIIIDYPIKPLCKTDCKGLCPKCGKNLNEGECGCELERSE